MGDNLHGVLFMRSDEGIRQADCYSRDCTVIIPNSSSALKNSMSAGYGCATWDHKYCGGCLAQWQHRVRAWKDQRPTGSPVSLGHQFATPPNIRSTSRFHLTQRHVPLRLHASDTGITIFLPKAGEHLGKTSRSCTTFSARSSHLMSSLD